MFICISKKKDTETMKNEIILAAIWFIFTSWFFIELKLTIPVTTNNKRINIKMATTSLYMCTKTH